MPERVADLRRKHSVYCLCPKCRAMFFSAKKFFITRVDPYQVEKDDCTFCQTGAGFDYRVVPRNPRSNRNGGYHD